MIRTLLAVTLLLAGSSVWAQEASLPRAGLILDLDADKGVRFEGDRVTAWKNQVEGKTTLFEATRPDGRPSVKKRATGGHGSVVFAKHELVCFDEDACDALTTGHGYTWLTVLAPHKQKAKLKDVNSFLGNLKNGGLYEGFWGGFDDDNTVWIGSRNGRTFGRWNDDNPKVSGPKLEEGRFYVVGARMGAGTKKADIELFVNADKPVASKPFPVNPEANASKLAIGQERDATNHPGFESFNGEIARLLIWDRPLAAEELSTALGLLRKQYNVP